MKFTNELRGVKSRLLLFSVLLLIPVMMFAQSITVKGTVLDSQVKPLLELPLWRREILPTEP